MPRPPLTDEQLRAITADAPGLFIEAHPGSGKTTVAAERFGVLRFSPKLLTDPRPVVATSFTKAATLELRQRIVRLWGPRALAWPHRVVTVDSLLRELLEWLLSEEIIIWPGGCRNLTVHDSWRGAGPTVRSRRHPRVKLIGRHVRSWVQVVDDFAMFPERTDFLASLKAGHCTHDEVRTIADAVLGVDRFRVVVMERLRETIRALIVDEAFDANSLDVALVAVALDAGVPTTLIGDPWQALYEFRGARPREVRGLTERPEMSCLPLTTSFRWRSEQQKELAADVRAGKAVGLPADPERTVDVVLAGEWRQLWEAGNQILPTAFGSSRADLAYAGATVLLSKITMARFGVPAAFVQDARVTLGLTSVELVSAADRWADSMIARLAADPDYDEKRAYADMASELGEICDKEFPAYHYTRGAYFKWLKPRLFSSRKAVAGITVHQSKGREWPTVGIVLSLNERDALAGGLDQDKAGHRRLYVACTRAQESTVRVGELGEGAERD